MEVMRWNSSGLSNPWLDQAAYRWLYASSAAKVADG